MNRYALGDGWTILWPLNGITIGLLLMMRRSDWPAILAGTIIGLGVGEYFDNNPLYIVIAQRIFSAAEVLLCALILPEFNTLESWLRSPRLSLRLYSALFVGPGLSGIAAALFAHYTQHQAFLIALNDWATADALGIVATLPVVLSLRTSEMRGLFEVRRLPTTIGTLALCFGVVVLIFSVSPYPVGFLLFPVLLLADVLLTFAGASLAALAACLLAVYLTIHHPGPFIRPYLHSAIERDLILQIYLSFHLFALFPASIVFLERRWMMRQIGDANVQLAMLAATDGLTGIPNRRAFEEHFAAEWRVATRSRRPLALLMLDLDCFKQFNDGYGHLAGDICLQRVAQTVLTVARRPRDMAARYGGEEFAVLLPDTSSEIVLRLANALRDSVYEQAIEHNGSPWKRVTVSIGCVSEIPEYGRPMTELVELADKSLYQAKSAGRNTVCSPSHVAAVEDERPVA